MSESQKIFFALLASVLLNIFIVEFVAIVWTIEHAHDLITALQPHGAAVAQPDLSQLTVTIMPARPTPPPPPPPKVLSLPTPPIHMVQPLIDSSGLTPSTKAPAKALFQSDVNMVAGSRQPATGNLPLPSQAGPQRKFIELATQSLSSGKGTVPAPPVSPMRPSAQNPPGMPEETPSAITQVQQSAPLNATPTPAPTAASTPLPKPIPTPAPELALGTPTPTPAAPQATPPMQLAKLTTPPAMRANPDMTRPMPLNRPQPPASQAEPSLQRQMEKTRVNGGITNPGGPGVDAVETPFGRYHRRLSDLIGTRWQLYIAEHPKNVGDVTIEVKLNPDGKVASTGVVDNHATDDLAELSTRAIVESDLPPVPDDLAPMLKDGKLDMTFSFSVYDSNRSQ